MNIAFKNAIGGSRDMKVGVTSTQIGNANSCMQFGWIWLTSVETVVPSFFFLRKIWVGADPGRTFWGDVVTKGV